MREQPDEIPLESRKRLLQYFFGRNKEAIRKVKEHGGRLTLTFWDSGQDQAYEITDTGVKRADGGNECSNIS